MDIRRVCGVRTKDKEFKEDDVIRVYLTEEEGGGIIEGKLQAVSLNEVKVGGVWIYFNRIKKINKVG